MMAFLGSILAYNAVLAVVGEMISPETPKASQNPQNSLDSATNDSVKQTAQNWMQMAQNWLTGAAETAYESARQAALQTISRQIDNQIKSTENQAKTSVVSVVDIIKENIGNAISQIKIFFVDYKNKLFKK